MTDKKNKLIALLYRTVATAGEMDFRTFALKQLREVLYFDSATWIDCAQFDSGAITIFDFLPFCVDPQLEYDIRASLHQNKIAKVVMQNKGYARIGNIDKVDPVEESDVLSLLLKHDLHHSIIVNISDPDTNLVNNICLYRRGSREPFEEPHRQLVDELMPDVVESFILYRRNQLNKRLFREWQEKYSAAYSSHFGLLRDIQPQCVELFQIEWPNWSGPMLPVDLIEYSQKGKGDFYKGRHIGIRIIEAGEFHILICSKIGELSALSNREQMVADKFVSGKTYKDVAEELHIAPSTAKKHLSNIYQKLNINDKTRLEEIMGRVFKA